MPIKRGPKEPRVKDSKTESDVSITAVARRARVSVGTVSRVINQHPKVDPSLRRRVQIASRQLGFIPRVQYRRIALLTASRSRDLPPVSYTSVLTAFISQYLAESHYSVELIEVGNLDLLYEAQTRGAIGVVFADDPLGEAIAIPNLPLLTINHPMTDKGVHSVRADHYRQGLLATEHYLLRGHRKIGMLVDQLDWGATERLRGYTDAMAAAGLEVDPIWVQATRGGQLYNIISRWTSRGVTGILNFSDDEGLEALHILSNILKLRIGVDISVISLEDMALYQYLTPPQTTVSQSLRDLARIAVGKMLDLCEDRVSDGDIINICLPTHLIERDSVATISS
ncbi:MAG: hypothetical protein JWM57_1444 [Phycisphaerales bacterium]|nr:hypothetical protein [Phycisphaerales bacterium]